MKKDLIFICSAQHTGTWFAIDALRNHPDAGTFMELKDMMDPARKDDEEKPGPMIVHTHYQAQRELGDGDAAAGQPKWLRIKSAICHALINSFPTVIPMRDPALSLITRAARHPDIDPEWVPLAFEELLSHGSAKFLAVDLPWSTEKRIESLRSVMKHCGLDHTSSWVEEYAEKWEAPAYNVTPPTPIKTAYMEGNKDSLMHLQAIYPKAVTELYGRKAALRKNLEALGYKDLLWW
jgi:hypothetical protein